MTPNTATDDPSRPDWVGQDALRWVIDDAPVPVDLAWTLTVIARKCDKDGKGSFQSKQTLAEKTGKSEAQVSRDIRELLKLGLIRLGDQTLPGRHGYARGQWPTVYDLAMEKQGPKPSRQSKNPTGRKKPASSDGETPRMDAGGGMDARGGMHAPDTPRMDASRTPCMDAPQRSPSRDPLRTPPPLPPADPATPPGASAREEGEGSSEKETQIADLVETIRRIRPLWSKRKIAEAITNSIADGRPWDAIVRAFPALASDPDTDYPGRLPQDGPWWEVDQQPRASERAASYDPPRHRRPVHPFQPDASGVYCAYPKCGMPRPHGNHRVGDPAKATEDSKPPTMKETMTS